MGRIPQAYRGLLREPNSRRFLTGLGVSSLGDALSTVTVAWLAVLIAPAGDLGIFVGLAVAAYTLPGVDRRLVLAPILRSRPSRTLVLLHCLLRAVLLGAIVVLLSAGALSPAIYVVLLAASSMLSAWGNAGEYTMLAELAGPDGRLAANSLAGGTDHRWPSSSAHPLAGRAAHPRSIPAGSWPSTRCRLRSSASRRGAPHLADGCCRRNPSTRARPALASGRCSGRTCSD